MIKIKSTLQKKYLTLPNIVGVSMVKKVINSLQNLLF